jgi:hypothetical protein
VDDTVSDGAVPSGQQQQQQQPEDACRTADEAADGILDDFRADPPLSAAVGALQTAAADPAAFLQPSSTLSQATREAAKVCHVTCRF